MVDVRENVLSEITVLEHRFSTKANISDIDVEIIAGAVYVDGVHFNVAILPKLSILRFMGYLKEKSILMIYNRHPELQSEGNKVLGTQKILAVRFIVDL